MFVLISPPPKKILVVNVVALKLVHRENEKKIPSKKKQRYHLLSGLLM